MELGGVIKTQHGGGTYIAARPTQRSPPERQRVLIELLTEFIARAGAAGFTVRELLDTLPHLVLEDEK
jgi:GntR family transcriptional regulator